ncbi:GDSL esterase/lipase CPRD49 [Camellia lanceoleosa]|uniref:GDSL esterase/lipase CPRD49 n=1 Tax=Camellia lanceoleosa TaxID=1840588 RepID=A0ACC0ITB6_9ERIC|nr:GDSL esterase/lipase CPRD49 [Camellia lanceoleosa]
MILFRSFFRPLVNFSHIARTAFDLDAAAQPSLVIVYFGGNDSMGPPHLSGLGPHIPLPESIENMRKIALHLKVVDLWTAIQRQGDWLTACFTDRVHLSAEGSKVVVEEILNVLKEAEWDPCLYWKSLPSEFKEDSPYSCL